MNSKVYENTQNLSGKSLEFQYEFVYLNFVIYLRNDVPSCLMQYPRNYNGRDCQIVLEYRGGNFPSCIFELLAPAEGCSLQLQYKGLLGPKVSLPDKRTDR